MLVYLDTLEPWGGERIDNKTLPPNIEQLWDKAALNRVGLAKVVPSKNANPPTKLHRRSGSTKEIIDGEAVETPTYELPSRDEFITTLKAHGWFLMGQAWWTRTTQNWLSYGDAVKARGVEILAAFDEGGSDIDISAGSVDGDGSWPE